MFRHNITHAKHNHYTINFKLKRVAHQLGSVFLLHDINCKTRCIETRFRIGYIFLHHQSKPLVLWSFSKMLNCTCAIHSLTFIRNLIFSTNDWLHCFLCMTPQCCNNSICDVIMGRSGERLATSDRFDWCHQNLTINMITFDKLCQRQRYYFSHI